MPGGAHRLAVRLLHRLATAAEMPLSRAMTTTAATAACGPSVAASRLAPPRVGLRAARVPARRLATCPAVPAPAETSTSPSAPGELTPDMVWAGRTAGAGTLSPADIGRTLTVAGWVHRARGLGGKTFVDVRDGTGLLQVVSADEGQGGDSAAAAAASLERLRAEFVVQVTGTLRRRKDPNPKLPTGEVELVAEKVRKGKEKDEREGRAFLY